MRHPHQWPIISAAMAAVSQLVDKATQQLQIITEASPIPPLTPRQVESFAYSGCTDKEIADRFLVDEIFIREQFADVLRATRAARAATIRRGQLDIAKNGNVSMLTWLGRNELGQSLNPTPPGEAEPELMPEKQG